MTSEAEADVERPATPVKSESKDASASAKSKEHGETGAKKPSRLKAWWDSLGLDLPTVLMMAKGGLPPAIALALYQVTAISKQYFTLGYLLAIVSILGMSIMPRAKFVQTMLLHIVMICTGTAMGLLIIYCTTQARKNTSTPATIQAYNSSASAVAGIWLFFQIYLVNAVRAKYPQLQLPVIVYSIFIIVTCTYAPSFPTMTYGISFIKQLLETFLTGFAISTAVAFLVLPVTVRTIVFKEFAGYVGLLQKCLRAHQAYLTSLEDPENLERAMMSDTDIDTKSSPQESALKGIVVAIVALHGKLQGDLPFAKREVALGKMGPEAITAAYKHIREIMLPTIGLTALSKLFERVASYHGWSQTHLREGLEVKEAEFRKQVIIEWSDNIKSLHESFDAIITASVEGLDHIMLRLQLKKPEKKAANGDVEEAAEGTRPGDEGFAAYLQVKIDTFYSGKQEVLKDWCARHGIELSAGFFDHPQDAKYFETDRHRHETAEARSRNQRQLFLLLYMEFLFWSAARGILAMVKFSDDLVSSGELSKTKLILPGWRRIRKWLHNLLSTDEGTNEDVHDLGDINQKAAMVDLGAAFNPRKDPEHLPPVNAWEKIGDGIRTIPNFFRSAASAFGFRVATATFSIAILAFLKQTHTWFSVHRVLWAMIMIAISMTPSAGQSVSSFILRILGTVIAMIAAFLIHYIPDGHTAGIIVLLWFFVGCGLYVPLKKPDFSVIGIISIVTTTLIIGYELEVQKIGVAAATSNGQEYLSIDILAPYRLGTVAAGLFVAFIFTLIPYPISEHSLLRQNVGGSIYLLANYYSIVHETVQARIKDAEGDLTDKASLGSRLAKLRQKVFSKQMLMLVNLRNYQKFLPWEIPIGGRFPKKQYEIILDSIDGITRYISLLSYASATLTSDDGRESTQWSTDLKQVVSSLKTTSHEVTSLLVLLSASMSNGQPLPPYLKSPIPYGLSSKLDELNPDLLSIRHIDEPEYATFAVFQIASRCIIHELDVLLKNVKELVGELDFSFRVASSASSSETRLGDGEGGGLKTKGD